jgi:polyphosphate kinase
MLLIFVFVMAFLLQRLRFLAISARNLDEFFCKRVGALKRQEAAGVENLITQQRRMAWTPQHQLKNVAREVRLMVETQIKCLMQDLLPALKKEGLNLLDYNKLHHHQKEQVSRSLRIFHANFYMMIFFSKFFFLFSVFQRNFFDQK